MEEKYIHTPQGLIFGMASGKPSSPLVLGIHGWSQRNGWHTWEPLIEPLASAGYYVVSIDMPGWGKSEPWGDGALSGSDGVQAVVSVLDEIGKESAVLMGKSWGGGIALKTAMLHQARIRKLMLTAPAFRNLGRVTAVVQPVLLVWAEDDPVIPFDYAKQFLSALPDAKLITYKTGGHNAAPKNASLFAPIAIDFLRV